MLENFRTQEMIWDFANRSIFENFIASEGDSNGRALQVQLFNGGQIVDASAISLSLAWNHANGNFGLDRFDKIDVPNGIFRIQYPTEMLSNHGTLNASLVLTTNEGRIESRRFPIKIEQSIVNDEAIESKDSFTALTKALIDVTDLETNYSPRLVKAEVKIGELGASAEFKGNDTYANILAKIGMKVGDEWYDTTNSRSLRWNGTAWLNVGSTVKLGDNSIPTIKYQDDSVTGDKMAGVIKNVGTNLFDKSKVTAGSYVANAAGEIRTGVASYSISDYEKVSPNTQYRKTGTLFTAFYKSKGVLSTITPAVSGSIFTTPADANFAVATFLTADVPTAMLIKGNTFPTSYIPYKESFSFDKGVYDIKPTNTTEERTRNEFNAETVTFGGYYDASGNFVNVPTYGLSGPIEVTEGEVVSKLTAGFSSWLDEDGNWMGSWHTTRQAKVPKNAKFLRAITNTTNAPIEMVVKGYEYPTSYIPHTLPKFDNTIDVLDQNKLRALTSNLYRKKWAFLGDSISDYLFSYPHLIAPKYKMNLVNMALSGRAMAKRGGQTDITYPPLVSIYQNVPEDVDVITVWIGTNDKGSNVSIGTIDSADDTTFMGAYNIMLTWLIENRPSAKILLITPMQRSDNAGQTGTPLINYVNAVEELGLKYGKRVLNMYKNSGIYVQSDVVKQQFIPDGLHPNYPGHKTFISPVIESQMLTI